MEAEDILIKSTDWNPTLHPRTGAPPNPGWFAPTDGSGDESSSIRTAANDDPTQRSHALPSAGDDWVRLPPGPKRIDELADFVEWIANARPEAESLIDGLASDVANKLKNLLGMMKRARLKLYENEITTVVQSKRGEVKRCKLDVRRPYVHDMKGRSYSEEEYLDAAFMAKSLGYDGVIIKNTYDPGSPAEIVGDDMTDVYVVFDSAQIRPT
jgi:hypothetical protein